MDETDSPKTKITAKRTTALFLKLVVFIIAGVVCLGFTGKQNPLSRPVRKINENYQVTKDAAEPQVVTKEPGDGPSSVPPKQPPVPPEPFLELNTENPISKDVSRLWHNEEMGAVCLSIPLDANCSHPLLIGRLSGPSISMLEWETKETGEATTFCGKYFGRVIQGAVHFVEILTLRCHDFSVGALSAETSITSPTSPRHTDDWLSFNWTDLCLQDMYTSRLTQENSAILTSTLPGESRNELSVPGYWTRNETLDLIPLYTRFLPVDCQGRDRDLPRCQKHMSTDRFDGYDFSWTSTMSIPSRMKANYTDVLKQCNCNPNCGTRRKCRTKCVNCAQSKINGKKVCIVGASNSYHLMYSLLHLQIGHAFHWINMFFPEEVVEGFFEQQYAELGCKIFVIGFGQWLASHKSQPYLFDRYLGEMTRIAQLVEDSSGPFQMYFRSMHHLPIADRAGSCPPTDWRTPAVVDGYNYLLQQAVIEGSKSSPSPKVHYLDTRFITHPMWDVAYDWYHVLRNVADEEALYIASVVLPD